MALKYYSWCFSPVALAADPLSGEIAALLSWAVFDQWNTNDFTMPLNKNAGAIW
jgi:hypothetical protein